MDPTRPLEVDAPPSPTPDQDAVPGPTGTTWATPPQDTPRDVPGPFPPGRPGWRRRRSPARAAARTPGRSCWGCSASCWPGWPSPRRPAASRWTGRCSGPARSSASGAGPPPGGPRPGPPAALRRSRVPQRPGPSPRGAAVDVRRSRGPAAATASAPHASPASAAGRRPRPGRPTARRRCAAHVVDDGVGRLRAHAAYTIRTAWKSSRRPLGARPIQCEVCASSRRDLDLLAALLPHLAVEGGHRRLAGVEPAAGQGPPPGAEVRADSSVSRTPRSLVTTPYAAARW